MQHRRYFYLKAQQAEDDRPEGGQVEQKRIDRILEALQNREITLQAVLTEIGLIEKRHTMSMMTQPLLTDVGAEVLSIIDTVLLNFIILFD